MTLNIDPKVANRLILTGRQSSLCLDVTTFRSDSHLKMLRRITTTQSILLLYHIIMYERIVNVQSVSRQMKTAVPVPEPVPFTIRYGVLFLVLNILEWNVWNEWSLYSLLEIRNAIPFLLPSKNYLVLFTFQTNWCVVPLTVFLHTLKIM